MRDLTAFIKSVLWVELAAISGLLIAGAILTWTEQGHPNGQNFFTYRIQHLDYLPAWFAVSLLLMAANGFWMFRLASVEGVFRTPRNRGWGAWSARFPVNPLRLLAMNLIAIPAALGLFLMMRINHW